MEPACKHSVLPGNAETGTTGGTRASCIRDTDQTPHPATTTANPQTQTGHKKHPRSQCIHNTNPRYYCTTTYTTGWNLRQQRHDRPSWDRELVGRSLAAPVGTALCVHCGKDSKPNGWELHLNCPAFCGVKEGHPDLQVLRLCSVAVPRLQCTCPGFVPP
jgi:hypothetical protein